MLNNIVQWFQLPVIKELIDLELKTLICSNKNILGDR